MMKDKYIIMYNKKQEIIKEYLTGKYTTKELSNKFKNRNGEPVTQRYIQQVLRDDSDVNKFGRTAHVPIFTALDVLYISDNPGEVDEILNRRYKEYYERRTKREHKYNINHWQGQIRRMKLRAIVMERDGFKCTECDSSIALEVHHKKPVREFPELEFDPSNCVTLCKAHTR
jgi:hypothetical protein